MKFWVILDGNGVLDLFVFSSRADAVDYLCKKIPTYTQELDKLHSTDEPEKSICIIGGLGSFTITPLTLNYSFGVTVPVNKL